MTQVAEIYTLHSTGPQQGSMTMPYHGYEVSLSTVFQGEVVVFNDPTSNEVLFRYPHPNAEGLIKAFEFIDNLIADERHAARREANTAW